MRKKRNVVILILLVLLCAALLATGTYAAYTSVRYVKRVISTRPTGEILCFSSNYLEECPQSPQDYVDKTISAGDGRFTINLDIYNFSLKDPSRFSANPINYSLTITLVNYMDSDPNQPDISELLTIKRGEESIKFNQSHEIPGGSPQTHTYEIASKDGKIDTLRQYKIRITAIPDISTTKMLAADLVLVSSAQSTPWDGKRIESDGSTYDAFNYELTGTSQEQRVLTWNPEEVALSPFSLKDLPTIPEDTDIAEVNRSGSVTLDLGADGTTSYRIQFYKVNGFKGTPDIVLK